MEKPAKEKQQLSSMSFLQILGDQPINMGCQNKPPPSFSNHFKEIKQILFPLKMSQEQRQCQKNQEIYLGSFSHTTKQCEKLKNQCKFLNFGEQNLQNPKLNEQVECLNQLPQNKLSQTIRKKRFRQRLQPQKNSKKISKKKIESMLLKQICFKSTTHKIVVSKFLSRIFFKYQERFCQFSYVRQRNLSISKIFNIKKTNIKDGIGYILGGRDEAQAEHISRENRRVMSLILQNFLHEEIIWNQFTQKYRLSYLIACKVYALRIRSPKLIKKNDLPMILFKFTQIFLPDQFQ